MKRVGRVNERLLKISQLWQQQRWWWWQQRDNMSFIAINKRVIILNHVYEKETSIRVWHVNNIK